jgi:putative transposase
MTQIYFLKLRLYLCQKDKLAICETMAAYQKACNFVSAFVWKTGITDRKNLNNALYRLVRKKYHLFAQMTQSIFRTVLGKYKMMDKQQASNQPPKFSKVQCDQVYGRDYYFLKNGRVSLGVLAGRLKPKFSKKGFTRFFDPGWKYGTSSLYIDENGLLYLIVTAKRINENEKAKTKSDLFVGVDRGIVNTMVAFSSVGQSLFFEGRTLKEKREKFLKMRSQLKERKTPSSRRHLKRMGRRENRFITNENHCLAKALLNSFPANTTFVFEKLKGIQETRGNSQKKSFRKAINVWSYYDLQQKIEIKAKEKNDEIVYISPENTSRTCPKCGFVDKKNRQRQKHLFHCKQCGFAINDDLGAAMNICRLGMRR